MASNKIYLADSKASVRKKLGLEHNSYDESFSKFEMICSHTYQFKIHIPTTTNWSDLDEQALDTAENLILEYCRKEHLKLETGAEEDVVPSGLAEWKLYQIHRAAQRKGDRVKKSIEGLDDGTSGSTSNFKPEVFRLPAAMAKPGYTDQ
ncbi:MAG: hypothetical protein L6R42_007046 [Xanthoria sp. 1 TBL-2021]|nr:MAG: hypothetical protein L6R42_007046 [Xanthoria sp. 1 TBL-2021]